MRGLRFTGVVLTGGASRRMGRDKALLEINGAPISVSVAESLREAGAHRVLAIGGDLPGLSKLASFDEVVTDDYPGEGPLGGILTALDRMDDDIVVILACDTPLIDAQTPEAVAHRLATEPTAAVAYAVVGGRAQPLTAAWRPRLALEPVRAAFAAGERAPRNVFAELPVIEVMTVPESGVADVDRPEDLQRYASESH